MGNDPCKFMRLCLTQKNPNANINIILTWYELLVFININAFEKKPLLISAYYTKKNEKSLILNRWIN